MTTSPSPAGKKASGRWEDPKKCGLKCISVITVFSDCLPEKIPLYLSN